MKCRLMLLTAVAAVLLVPAVSRGEVKVVFERNADGAATGQFKFKDVPAPSKTDAATAAKCTVVAGRADSNGAGVDALNDGVVPSEADQPDKAGWKFLASIDTRPKEGEPGGQYGVSISDPAADTLAKCRYLLFDVSRTEVQDPFGNTFFSEIDVSDGKEHAAPEVKKGTVTTATIDGYTILFDTTQMPELQQWVEKKLRPACLEWYPKIIAMLPSEGYSPPKRVTIQFRKSGGGVAATSGTRVICGGDWFKRNLEGEAAGAVVHELVHVVQQYGRSQGGNANPGWLVEGVADYIRWFHYEPPALRPRPNPARAKYTDSYRTTGAFLNYVTEKHDKEIVKKLNAAMRQGKYTPELWKEYTGKTVDELWAEYVETLKAN